MTTQFETTVKQYILAQCGNIFFSSLSLSLSFSPHPTPISYLDSVDLGGPWRLYILNKLPYHATAALQTIRGASVGMDGNTVRLRCLVAGAGNGEDEPWSELGS